MKITLEPTESKTQHSVVIETQHDGHDIDEIRELLRGALIAWGFHPETVNELFGEEL